MHAYATRVEARIADLRVGILYRRHVFAASALFLGIAVGLLMADKLRCRQAKGK